MLTNVAEFSDNDRQTREYIRVLAVMAQDAKARGLGTVRAELYSAMREIILARVADYNGELVSMPAHYRALIAELCD